jgi:hypothetical protein
MTLPRLITACCLICNAPANAAVFVEYDISGGTSGPRSSHTGIVGTRFGVEGNDIPSGQTVQVTHLGFFAGISGQFTGAGVVDFDHTVSFSGPRGWDTRSGDYSSLLLASVTVSAGNPVDASGWSWVALPTPIDLIGSQYYVIATTVTSGQTADPYFDPVEGAGGSATLSAPGSIFRNGSGNDTYMIGRYGLAAGQEAYAGTGYLGANFQYQVIPEPASAGLALGCLALAFRRRRG